MRQKILRDMVINLKKDKCFLISRDNQIHVKIQSRQQSKKIYQLYDIHKFFSSVSGQNFDTCMIFTQQLFSRKASWACWVKTKFFMSKLKNHLASKNVYSFPTTAYTARNATDLLQFGGASVV